MDILAIRNGTILRIQAKYAYRLSKNRYQIGGKHGSHRNLGRADWIVAVLPDHRMFIIPKKLIRPNKAIIRFNLARVREFRPGGFYLFTDVMVHSSTEESELASQLPPPIPGYQNTAAFYPDENRAEVYLRETLKVIRRFYRSAAEDLFIHLVVTRLTANIIHEMIHAALLRSFMNEREIQRMAIVMTQ